MKLTSIFLIFFTHAAMAQPPNRASDRDHRHKTAALENRIALLESQQNAGRRAAEEERRTADAERRAAVKREEARLMAIPLDDDLYDEAFKQIEEIKRGRSDIYTKVYLIRTARLTFARIQEARLAADAAAPRR